MRWQRTSEIWERRDLGVFKSPLATVWWVDSKGVGQRWGPDRRLWQVPMKEMPGPQLVHLASASSLHCIGFDRFIGDLCVAKPHMILSAGLSLPECPLCAQHHGSFRLNSLPAPPAPTTQFDLCYTESCLSTGCCCKQDNLCLPGISAMPITLNKHKHQFCIYIVWGNYWQEFLMAPLTPPWLR